MKKCNNIDCEKKELCEKFLMEEDKVWDNWFKSLPEHFRNMMCEHYLEDDQEST